MLVFLVIVFCITEYLSDYVKLKHAPVQDISFFEMFYQLCTQVNAL